MLSTGILMSNPKLKIVYLVDDDEDDRLILTEAIKTVSLEITVIELTSGLELLKYFNAIEAPLLGLIVLDMNMPAMDGLETIENLKANQKVAHFPIIMVSTSPEHVPGCKSHKVKDIHWYKKAG